jgi:hypothetical protein
MLHGGRLLDDDQRLDARSRMKSIESKPMRLFQDLPHEPNVHKRAAGLCSRLCISRVETPPGDLINPPQPSFRERTICNGTFSTWSICGSRNDPECGVVDLKSGLPGGSPSSRTRCGSGTRSTTSRLSRPSSDLLDSSGRRGTITSRHVGFPPCLNGYNGFLCLFLARFRPTGCLFIGSTSAFYGWAQRTNPPAPPI